MKQYLDLSKRILMEGEYEWNDRTETGTLSKFGELASYDLREGFPLLTTKKMASRLPIEEMLFFLRGEDNVKRLTDKNVNIWNANAFDFYLSRHDLKKEIPKHTQEWRDKFSWYIDKVKNDEGFAKKEGTLGRVYGVQWRDWTRPNGEKVDQIDNFIKKLKGKDPTSRSNIVSAFNPGEKDEMALGPCHLLCQSRVVKDKNRLDLLMYQRSADNLLGVPFNVAQYSFLNHLVSRETGFEPGKFEHQLGNVHFYTGIQPRTNFLRDEKNLDEFQDMVKKAKKPDDYLEIRDWYLKNAPEEPEGTEGLDHIPFALTQLARTPKEKPSLELKLQDGEGFWDAIKKDARDLRKIRGYNSEDKLTYEYKGKTIEPIMAA